MTSEAMIVTGDLNKVYSREIHAVVDLCMEVRTGEIYGFLGPNGAGKSTTIGMLTTRVIPTSGAATVGGVHALNPRSGCRGSRIPEMRTPSSAMVRQPDPVGGDQ